MRRLLSFVLLLTAPLTIVRFSLCRKNVDAVAIMPHIEQSVAMLSKGKSMSMTFTMS